MALYVKKDDGSFLLNENVEKIQYTVDHHSKISINSTKRVRLSINDDGHVETNKNLIVKPAENDNHVVIKSQVGDIVRDSFLDLWVSEYLRMYANCVYQIDRADGQNVKMDSSRKVETIYDKSNEESDATQTDSSKRPTVCTKAEKHNGRYFLKFNGSQKMISQVDLNNNAVNVFIVYKLNSRGSVQAFWSNGLFGMDNGGYDFFVAHSGSNLVVSGASSVNNCIYIGPAASLQSFLKLDDYSVNDLGELNNGEIGLLGPGNGCLTWLFEKIFGWVNILNSHSILHDAFGRFYDHYDLGRGYTYAIPSNYTTRFIKRSPLCGQISGLLYCICRRLTI